MIKNKIKRKVTKVKFKPIGLIEGDQVVENSVKIVQIDNGKSVSFANAAMSLEHSRAIFHCLAHIIGLRDAQHKLKGTTFYSSAIEKELSRYSDTKLKTVFEQLGDREVSDGVFEMANKFSLSCDHFHQLAYQPEETKKRFERDYKDLLVLYGITF